MLKQRVTRLISSAAQGEVGERCSGLTDAYEAGIIICMRTTLNIDDALLAKAGEYTGEVEKTALVRMGLEALIQREAARRLALLGGAMPDLDVAPRRRLKAKRRS